MKYNCVCNIDCGSGIVYFYLETMLGLGYILKMYV